MANVLVSSIFSISSRRASSTGQVAERARASVSSGNHTATFAAHPARSSTSPSQGRIPSTSAEATYLRTVFGSTPKLADSTSFGRPACQCCKISTTSIIWNVLLAIRPALVIADSDEQVLSVDSEPPAATRPATRELRERPVGNYVNARTSDQGIT